MMEDWEFQLLLGVVKVLLRMDQFEEKLGQFDEKIGWFDEKKGDMSGGLKGVIVGVLYVFEDGLESKVFK